MIDRNRFWWVPFGMVNTKWAQDENAPAYYHESAVRELVEQLTREHSYGAEHEIPEEAACDVCTLLTHYKE